MSAEQTGDDGGLLPRWALTVSSLGLGGVLVDLAEVGDELVDFGQDPTGYVVELLQYRLVEGILIAWAWFLDNVLANIFEGLRLGLVEGIAIPIRDGFTLGGTAIYGALGELQMWTTGGLMTLGIGAPFAIAISWLVTAVIVAALFQILWGFLETYLPIESLSGAFESVKSAFRGESS
jgi:hypothetical protein